MVKILNLNLFYIKEGVLKYLNPVNAENCVGKVLKSKKYGDFKVVDYKNHRNVTVEFLKTGYRKVCEMKEIKTGGIKDIKLPSIYGVGFVGNKYKTSYLREDGSRVNANEYERWKGLLRRCYSEKDRHKFPTYRDCEVSENFKSYEFFYEWCNKQVGHDKGFDLDKDLLSRGNKIYSEHTCIFVPKEINCSLSKNDVARGDLPIGVHFCTIAKGYIAQVSYNDGTRHRLGKFDNPLSAFNAYKSAKEEYLKLLAEKWKDEIDERAYTALIKYEVKLTD